jgi:hypothetical protein
MREMVSIRFDYDILGEFYSRKTLGFKPTGLNYRRFETAAQALRFAIEELSSALLSGSVLEVDGERFGAKEMRTLYVSSHYPLRRKNRQ